MSNFNNLIGLSYVEEKNDCFSLLVNYFWQVWGIRVPNFARPSRFWEYPNMDIYDQWRMTDFEQVFDQRYQIGDAVLMPILARTNNHGGVIVEDNQILHHLPNRLSSVEPFKPKWADRVTVHLRHPKITEALKSTIQTVHLHEVVDAELFRDPRIQREIEKQMGPRE